jgi:hypothetical protein
MGIPADACEAKIPCQAEELLRVISRPSLINCFAPNSFRFFLRKNGREVITLA